MAKMTFELIPLREVETGPVGYGFGWVNVGDSNKLWVHNPITEAVNPNQSYTTPHTSSEGWLFDFKLNVTGSTETFIQCDTDDRASGGYLTYFIDDEYPIEHDCSSLLKSLTLSETDNKIATGQILLDNQFVYELYKRAFIEYRGGYTNELRIPNFSLHFYTQWVTSNEDIVRYDQICEILTFSFRLDDETIYLMLNNGSTNVIYNNVTNGLSNTLFNPDTANFKYELVKGYNYESSQFVSVIKVTLPLPFDTLNSGIDIGDDIFMFIDPVTESAKHYGTITKTISNLEFEVTIQNGFNDVVVTDSILSLMSNKYLIYDTDNISKQYSFRILPKATATIEQSKTSLKAVEFIESNENQIAFQRGGRVWCKELIENNYEENIEFHKNAKISPNLITSLNGTGYEPEEGSQDIYITIDNDTNTARSRMPAPATHIAFTYNLVKDLKVTLPTPEKMEDAPVFYCSGLPYDYSKVVQGKTPELEFVFYKDGFKKLTMSTNDNLGGCTAGLLNETGDYTVDVNLVYPQYGKNPSGIYWDLTIYPQIEVQVWENGQGRGPSPFSKYGTILSKDYYIQAKEFKE